MIKVGLIYGGKSFEHAVSMMTAGSIWKNIDRRQFAVTKIYIDKKGNLNEKLLDDIDVAFLAVHGPNCEDGRLQEFLEKRGIKYTGSRVNASRLNMDKIKMHQIFQKANLKTVAFLGFNKQQKIDLVVEKIIKEIGFPCFVKPNNTGSSMGVAKVATPKGLVAAIKKAFCYDHKIIVEKTVIQPREIEVAILDNQKLVVSEPGEILTNGQVYSYQKKYFKPFATAIKANLPKTIISKIKKMAEKAYRATGCRGYARVDFFLDQNNQVYINEINTLPGFTEISMFPKIMMATGISYQNLITKIIQLALDKGW
ncbi:MAG: D-alanine-D-alanine ligase [Candidatus Berkelbacteria bacterium Licking1014_2]|uniref:D-alanine--D-alanine ligase n=1 Tax=Candidatus Berkelbacteria bacterium Licking1014_2 TaxID=2017146 RepID=A0A554LV43_9BACT|nr:MAG: D-alanine-D-alanine ligase [Candidatus Berkelbacteria bacterium Licking1014_2]